MRVLFLADQLASEPRSESERHPGGAELSDAAALAACPFPLTVRRVTDVEPGEVARHDAIILANAERAPAALLAAVADGGRHVLIEHDLRICDWRGNFPASPDPRHKDEQRCACPHPAWRAVLERARGIVFVTERQRRAYHDNPYFAVLGACPEVVLGASIFSPAAIDEMRRLARDATRTRAGACVLGSPSPFKGRDAAVAHCRERGWSVRELRDLAPDAVLRAMAEHQRFVFLPVGVEAGGRMPVEARLCGCEVVINGQLGHTGEPFWAADTEAALELLYDGPARFWRLVESLLDGQVASRPPATAEVLVRELFDTGRERRCREVRARIDARLTFAPWI